jgi:two-component system, NarL family, invasion response regulator UvrY
MIKVLVADIYPVARLGIKDVLFGVQGMEVVDEAGSGQELLDKVGRNDCDVIIFEIALPAGNGLDLLRELRKKNPKAAILIFTSLPEDEFIIRALKLGAAGYLSKQSEPEDLIKAIHKIAQGGKYVSEDLAELLADTLNLNLDKPTHQKLSDREYQILILIVSGKRQIEIAEILSLGHATIGTHLRKIYSKLKISNKSELVRYVIKNNLVGKRDDRSVLSQE